MASSSFSRTAWKTATIKAPAPIVNGKRSGTTTIVATVQILPLMPASSDIVNRIELQTPTKLLSTYFEADEGLTFKEGFTLAIDGVEYPVKALSPWYFGSPNSTKVTYELVVEDLRNK